MTPKISIITSVYNGEQYLREAIESILNQTYVDFEFIIVNDASTDGSTEILRSYAKQHPRIILIENEHNQGLTKNLNKAIAISQGEYIARFDADDRSIHDRLRLQIEYLETHQNVGIVGSWADIIDERGIWVRTVRYPTENDALKKVLIRYNPFFHSAIMVRRSVFNTVGLYNEQWRFAQDYELYFRIAKQYELANLPIVLIQYRETGSSITASKNRKQIGFVLRSKLKALHEGQYSVIHYIDLIPTYISWLLPIKIKRLLKKLFS